MEVIEFNVRVCGNGVPENTGSCAVGDILQPILELDRNMDRDDDPGK